MPISVSQVLQSQQKAPPRAPLPPSLLIAGAAGALGSEVAHQLVGAHVWRPVTLLTREPMRAGLGGLRLCNVATWPALTGGGDAPAWPPQPADVAVVMFEPPRPWHERERALWTPTPAELPALARWLRASGVRRLAVVVPHAPGRLPDALQHGLANLDEAAVAQLDFDCLLWLRAADARAGAASAGSLPQRLAAWMLGVTRHMLPDAQRPLRPASLAQVLQLALRVAPPGVHVLGPELLHAAARQPEPGPWLRLALGGQGTIGAAASAPRP